MTPTQKIKWALLVKADREGLIVIPSGFAITATNVDAYYTNMLVDCGLAAKLESAFRPGEAITDLPVTDLQPLDCLAIGKSVAAGMPDGTWVGWTYWTGGIRISTNHLIPWMPTAYEVVATDLPRYIIERTFKRMPNA